ncbi:hypothetical protein RZS08_67370, partial [Arthrospira platensis SPKY1]|nr:hypothetical protein [Arthrospira platensis SPKY1]
CQSVEEEEHYRTTGYEAKVKPDDATLQMIQKVQEAYAKVDPEVMGYVGYVLNRDRADLLKRKLDEMEVGADRNLVVYDYGIELLRAGKTEEAIEVFENF